MKSGSDNFRSSAINDIIKGLKSYNNNIIIYEPTIEQEEYAGCKVINNLNEFKEKSSIIMANRIDDNLEEIKDKIYTRDLFGEN